MISGIRVRRVYLRESVFFSGAAINAQNPVISAESVHRAIKTDFDKNDLTMEKQKRKKSLLIFSKRLIF